MPEITHSQVARFAAERVNLPHNDAAKHRAQVNGLRDRLATKITDDPGYGLVKSLHAGSVAKRTALRSVNDLDLAVYVKAAEAPTKDAELVPWLADRLYEATTNMNRDQFEEQTHCVTVHYRGSGLDVDVVPVLYEGEANDVGYLIKKHTGDRLRTSTRLHLDFIANRRKTYGLEFLELIRLTKWWKRQIVMRTDPDFKFKSFMIELIWAHLADTGVSLADYPKALEAFFEWIVKTGLEERVTFTDYTPASAFPAPGSAPVEILDPVNPENNVAIRYDNAGRDKILNAAASAYDALTDARFATTKGRAVDNWQELLGPTFKG
ncbi:CBASS oligonucleotide cyclase [Arthrobacter sp. EH-1B-1]|uniref:CBASS oligonucleotide cyclase n=1 Tax=Arthrobacter vasquezii TaxID=2977629 RepID=A0ABT6CWG9_9MICC|nr:CBASS oligonucleotide cyclase [Arthrobacter vasquezii]MDF9278433.1 CBASS oligonucleotide cyclase [Arthrobacter vasquezii]